jgi:hypothetical protein
LGFGGIYGGISFITDPTGSSMNVSQSYLTGLPIQDYGLPGILLLVGFGIFPLILAVALWMKPAWLAPLASHYMGWIITVMLSIGLMLWMLVQIGIMGIQQPIQIIIIVVALMIFVLAFLPQTRAYYADNVK